MQNKTEKNENISILSFAYHAEFLSQSQYSQVLSQNINFKTASINNKYEQKLMRADNNKNAHQIRSRGIIGLGFYAKSEEVSTFQFFQFSQTKVKLRELQLSLLAITKHM